MNELTLSLLQPNLAWEQPEENLAKLSRLWPARPTDLVLLPEMFSTGFTMKPSAFAETEKGDSVQWMQEKARHYQTAVCGSLVIEEDGRYFNRLFFVFPDGSYKTYNKRHLFTLAGEDKVYSPGTEKLLIQYKGWKIIPLVCYDLRFPVWCRNSEEAELMLFVANWPERRADAWKTLLKARAVENMCYVAGLNRVGEDGNEVAHSGDSAVYDELGTVCSELTPGREMEYTLTIQKDQVHRSRERFSFLKDRDAFRIQV